MNAHNSDTSPARTPSEPVGIGLRGPYYQDIKDTDAQIGWLEVHPENYFGGGLHRQALKDFSQDYAISLHAVGMSLGSDQELDFGHLGQIKELVEEINPFHISDHASWSMSGNAHLNDLLPLPYTQEVLDKLARNVSAAQDFFGREMLVENPSTYIDFANNEMSEFEFMNRLSDMTGCFLLLDINNIFVQASNHGFDAYAYIDGIDASRVREMHLAGHTEQEVNDRILLVDTHNQPVREDVWDLYEHAIERIGVTPTLIEWDQDYPALDELLAEAEKARTIINHVTNKTQKNHGAETVSRAV